jgi:O-antigen/teichoic acid export membrane protein
MTIVKKIAYNTFISTGARIIGVALSLIGIGFITRYLGQEGFGSYSLILVFVSIFDVLADFGLYSLMTREISKPGADEKKVASNIFTIRIFTLLIFLAIAIVSVWFFPYPLKIKTGVAVMSLSCFFLSACQVLMGIFQKNLRTDKPSIAEILGRFFQLLLVVFVVHFDLGFLFVLIASLFSSILIFLMSFIFSRKYIIVSFAFDFFYWKKIIREAIPIAISVILTLVYFKIDSIFLSLNFINRFSPSPLSDVGIYGIAYKVLEGLIFFPAMFVGLIMPLLSGSAASDKEQFKKIFQKTLNVLIIFIVPLVVGVLILAMPIVKLIGGNNFIESAPVLRILSFAVGLIFLGSLFGNSIIALNRQKVGAWIYFGGMIFNIVTNLIFIPKYRYLGAAGTTVATEFLVTFLMMVLIYKTIHYFPSFKIIFKVLIGGIAMGVFIWFFRGWNLFLLVGLGIAIYFGVLYFIKGIRKEEIALLIKK